MRKIILLPVLFFAANLYAQQRQETHCHSSYTVFDQKQPDDFISEQLTDSVRKRIQPKYHLWIGYYAADTSKKAFVAAYEKTQGGLVNRFRKIKTAGYQIEFYRNHPAKGKMYCGFNQAIRKKIYFVNGKVSRFEEYHPSGMLKSSGQYNRAGDKDGLWIWKDESGRIIKKENWNSGKTS